MREEPVAVDAEWLDALARRLATAPVNLVSKGDRPDVRGLHIDECVAVSRRLAITDGSRWMDLGTGGGLPGLVLARAFPAARWVLVDARAKKVDVVTSFAAALGLGNVDVVHGRAEDLAADPGYAERFEGVISRAAGSLAQTIVLGRPFVSTGEIVAVRGPKVHDEVAGIDQICHDIGLTIGAVEQVEGTIRPTWLVRLRVQGPAPKDFPRIQREVLRAKRGGTSDGSA